MKLHQLKIRKERRRCQGAESPVMTKGRGEITHLFTSEKHRGWRKGPEPETMWIKSMELLERPSTLWTPVLYKA